MRAASDRGYTVHVNKNKTNTLLWLAGKNQLQDTTKTTTIRTITKICIATCTRIRMLEIENG